MLGFGLLLGGLGGLFLARFFGGFLFGFGVGGVFLLLGFGLGGGLCFFGLGGGLAAGGWGEDDGAWRVVQDNPPERPMQQAKSNRVSFLIAEFVRDNGAGINFISAVLAAEAQVVRKHKSSLETGAPGRCAKRRCAFSPRVETGVTARP